jgi:hypothetical protein
VNVLPLPELFVLRNLSLKEFSGFSKRSSYIVCARLVAMVVCVARLTILSVAFGIAFQLDDHPLIEVPEASILSDIQSLGLVLSLISSRILTVRQLRVEERFNEM